MKLTRQSVEYIEETWTNEEDKGKIEGKEVVEEKT